MARWFIEYLDAKGWHSTGEEFATKREAVAVVKQMRKENPGWEIVPTPMNSTTRETYSRIIGYNFGTDKDGNDCIYNGSYMNTDTGKKQYEFLYYDRSGNVVAQFLTDYKGFREIIDKFDWPKR